MMSERSRDGTYNCGVLQRLLQSHDAKAGDNLSQGPFVHLRGVCEGLPPSAPHIAAFPVILIQLPMIYFHVSSDKKYTMMALSGHIPRGR